MSDYPRPLWPLLVALAVPAVVVALGGIVAAVAYFPDSQPREETTRQRVPVKATEQERLASKPLRPPETEKQVKTTPIASAPIADDAKEKKIVEDYLRRNLNDPAGMEIVESGTEKGLFSRLDLQPGGADDEFLQLDANTNPEAKKELERRQAIRPWKPCAMLLVRFRAKNAFGALAMNEVLFVVQDGAVTASVRVKSDPPVPHDTMVVLALAEIGHFKPEKR